MNEIHYLEGIRGVGAMIVFSHFQRVIFPQFNAKFFGWVSHYLPEDMSYNIVQVCDLYIIGLMFPHIFRALSGYVIFKKFFRAGGVNKSYSTAVVKHFKPALLAVFVIFLFGRAFLHKHPDQPDLISSLLCFLY